MYIADRTNPSVPFPRSYWVLPGRLPAGEYPGSKDPDEATRKIKNLFESGIRRVINLMEPDETDIAGAPFRPYENILSDSAGEKDAAFSCLRFPIRDVSIPSPDTMAKILDSIDEGIEAGNTVYVHCLGGIGRTGGIYAAF
jgi:predicted protein tyrosine phosphatase